MRRDVFFCSIYIVIVEADGFGIGRFGKAFGVM